MNKTIVKDIIAWFQQWAPKDLAESWDSVGLQIGNPSSVFDQILVSLEVDELVLNTLSTQKNTLVITHHPLFFKPLKFIRYDQDMGKILSTFFKGNHQLFTAHTNLDAAKDGVNDCLIEQFNLNPSKGQFLQGDFGKYFDNPKISYSDCIAHFNCNQRGSINNDPIKRLAFCAGSGHGFISRLVNLKVDTYITGEITYHDHVTCRMNDIRVIELGHKESELWIVPRIKERLRDAFPTISVGTC